MELLGDVGHLEPRFGPFGYNVRVSARLVRAKRTIGSEIVLDAALGTPS
jgi:hypothetical protein